MLIPVLFGCYSKNKQIEKLIAKNDSLMHQTEQRDETINDFIQSFNEIEENLEIIKEKEEIITLSTGDGNIELEQDAKDKINQNIRLIYELMLKNKQTIARLNKLLKSSNIKIAEFEKMIARMTQQLEEKSIEINILKDELADLNIVVEDLTADIDSLTIENIYKEEIITEKTEALNTAFYVYGTKKELLEHKIITKEGGFIGIGRIKKLMQDFDKDYFTEIDITETKTIPLFCKKAQLITSHPSSSYNFEGDDKADKLIITNSDEFWSISKYLVILVE